MLKRLLVKPCSAPFIAKLLLYTFPKLSTFTLHSVSKKLQKRLYSHLTSRLSHKRSPQIRFNTPLKLNFWLRSLSTPSLSKQPRRLPEGDSPYVFHNTNLHVQALKIRYSSFPRTLDQFTTVFVLHLYTFILHPLVAYRKSFLAFRCKRWTHLPRATQCYGCVLALGSKSRVVGSSANTK